MSLLLCGQLAPREAEIWLQHLSAAMPQEQWLMSVNDANRVDVEVAVVAPPLPAALNGLCDLPGLRLIQSLWAGVERLLAEPRLPAQVPILRLVDPAMNRAMAETALWATLALQRGFFDYADDQRAQLWRPLPQRQRRAEDTTVTVLGLGQMGGAVAAALVQRGYRVIGWRTQAGVASVSSGLGESMGIPIEVHAGAEALLPLLARSDIVINLLPLTPATRGLLDRRFFAAMQAQAALVNLARGAHVVDADLLEALDAGHLAHAVLDVYAQEPLPAGHRYWTHPCVTMLPHVAALTDPRSAAAVVASNVRALRAGEPLAHCVDRERGY